MASCLSRPTFHPACPLPLSLSLSLSRARSLARSLSLSLFHSLSISLSHSLSLSLTLPLSLYVTLSLSLSLLCSHPSIQKFRLSNFRRRPAKAKQKISVTGYCKGIFLNMLVLFLSNQLVLASPTMQLSLYKVANIVCIYPVSPGTASPRRHHV
jgi:hypothetical protein